MNLLDYPKTRHLKDKTEIILRPMVKEDKDELFRFFNELAEEDRLFLRDDVTDENVIQKWAENIDYTKVFPILAFHKNKIVGDATLHRAIYGWSRHTGEIRMVVSREFQKKGLGTILVKELVNYAINIGLDKIIVQIAQPQIGAINIMKKLGFVEEAVLKDYVIDIRGKKSNLIIMSHDVTHLWKKMEDLLMDWLPSHE